eukprot:TRINITY_DN13993_c1_g7_i1.p1 TRINITY_DN13993_c1_g7~~TRINITY_DN13993_c1_g7_i1.p1  ORF type:complete len:467 (+),score=48.48 TRINITY_DN13993_c1_g7_i1:139-1539(+)
MIIVLLSLDEDFPLPSDCCGDLLQYLRTFFCAECRIEEIPATVAALPGWEAMKERLNHPLRVRPGRPNGRAKWQLHISDLVASLEALKSRPEDDHGVALDDAELVLALTRNELLSSEVGLVPGEPGSAEATRRCFAASTDIKKCPVGVCSLSRMLPDSEKQDFRKFFRQLLKFVSHSVVHLLSHATCQVKTCLAFWHPLNVNERGFLLCARCEAALLERMAPSEDLQSSIKTAVTRYHELAELLREAGNEKLCYLKIGYRKYPEFEEECDWLRVAEDILRECSGERHAIVDATGRKKSRRRSLLSCLLQVHERQSPQGTSHRTFSEPFLRRTCLVDMATSPSYGHGTGDLSKWSMAVQNRKHQTGGLYVEVGGSLKAKNVSLFVDAGLNASLIRHEGASETTQADRMQKVAKAISERQKNDDEKTLMSRTTDSWQTPERPLVRRRNAHSLGYTANRRDKPFFSTTC